jgi:hypothetical protein
MRKMVVSSPSFSAFVVWETQITPKRNVQVRWPPNSAGLVAILCDDRTSLGIHKGVQVHSLCPLPKISRP